MRAWQALLLLWGIFGSIAVSSATTAEEGHDDVLVLITDNFAEYVERLESPALVQFVAADCKACIDLAPTYKKVATNLKGLANVATVNCSSVHSVRTCKSYAAHKFPRFMLFKPGTKLNPYTGGAMKEALEYRGKLTGRDLAAAVTDLLDTKHITTLSNIEEHDKFLQQEPRLAKVLLFTNKTASTVLYKGLSWAYARRLACAEVHAAEASQLVEQYGVQELPKLLVVTTDGEAVSYTGPLQAVPLRDFLDKYATKQPLTTDPAANVVDSMLEPILHSLTADNLTDIDGKEDMWLVAFYSSKDHQDCPSELNSYKQLLHEVQSIVNFGSVNAASLPTEQLQVYGLDNTALESDGCKLQLVLFPWGTSKTLRAEFLRWSKGLDDAKELQEWILAKVPDFTAHLTDELEAEAFVAATGESLPDAAIRSAADRKGPVAKVFLFSTKRKVPGIYKALAMQFHGKSRLLFGWTTPDDSGPGYPLMQKMSIRKAPAMSILFPLPPKPVGDPKMAEVSGPQADMAMQQYLGPIKYSKMLQWLQAMAQLTGVAFNQHAGTMPPPTMEDFEIRSQSQLDEACYDKHSLCMMVLLDGRSSEVNKYKDITKKVALDLHGNPLTWVVIDVSQQRDFRSAYGFTADQLPGLVALSSKRLRFAQGASPFSEENAKQLVTKVLAGSATTLPIPALPQLVDGGQPEEDGAVEDTADEFDLKDIMAEEVTASVPSKEERLKEVDRELEAQARKRKSRDRSFMKKGKKGKKGSSRKKYKKAAPRQPKDEL